MTRTRVCARVGGDAGRAGRPGPVRRGRPAIRPTIPTPAAHDVRRHPGRGRALQPDLSERQLLSPAVPRQLAQAGCMDEVRRRMGYRFALVEGQPPGDRRAGRGAFGVPGGPQFEAGPGLYNPRPVEILLRDLQVEDRPPAGGGEALTRAAGCPARRRRSAPPWPCPATSWASRRSGCPCRTRAPASRSDPLRHPPGQCGRRRDEPTVGRGSRRLRARDPRGRSIGTGRPSARGAVRRAEARPAHGRSWSSGSRFQSRSKVCGTFRYSQATLPS